MRYLSVCSGIEAATVAWHPLGWEPVAFSEIEAFPSAVLAHHYPTVPNYGDMTRFQEWPDANVDVLVGGTPCQSFSVAGLRGGMADLRGNLAIVYLALADRYRPRWLVWENVPGVLSSGGGRDFGAFLGGLAALGYGFAYRVLDAQYFGLAQRRKRVFVVGYLGDWRRAAAVLLEPASLRGDSAPRRKAREGVAASLSAGSNPGSNAAGRRREDDVNLVAHSVKADGFDASEDGTGRVIPLVCGTLSESSGHARPGDNIQSVDYLIPALANPLTARMHKGINTTCDEGQTMIGAPIAFHNRQDPDVSGDVTHPLGAQDNGMGVGVGVRRLTPRECERLQGFPDDYTLIPYRNKPASDGPRYKALGNSMAVPVMRWLGARINQEDV